MHLWLTLTCACVQALRSLPPLFRPFSKQPIPLCSATVESFLPFSRNHEMIAWAKPSHDNIVAWLAASNRTHFNSLSLKELFPTAHTPSPTPTPPKPCLTKAMQRTTKPTEPISRYAMYLRELWRANETRTANICCAPSMSSSSLRSRAVTGVALGATSTAWIFSNDACFALGMAAQAVVAQLEYFRMAIASGAAPARRIVLCASVTMLYAAGFVPALHELVFPLAGTWIMLWFLLMRPNCSSINDISTTLMGLFYTSYLPSWWVRLRCSPAWQVATPATALDAPSYLGGLLVSPQKLAGAVAVWWTCLSVAAADIGAYFGGKTFGRRSLASIGLGAAGKASPNKTLEGALSGFLASMLVSTIGAAVMHWPLWAVTGPLYGLALSMVALVGDLTASMLKRDGNFKDYGDLLPGHGGLLDRLDGFIFVAPVAYCLLPKFALGLTDLAGMLFACGIPPR